MVLHCPFNANYGTASFFRRLFSKSCREQIIFEEIFDNFWNENKEKFKE
jgi:hypothetical protein